MSFLTHRQGEKKGLLDGHTTIVGIFFEFLGLEKKYPCQCFGNAFGMKVALHMV
jgi:hypothetical protein